MRTFAGTGELYEEGKLVRRVGVSVTYVEPPPLRVTAMGGSHVVAGAIPSVSGALSDIGGSGDFFNLMGPNRTFIVKFDGGGQWECMLKDPSGTALSSGALVLPPSEG